MRGRSRRGPRRAAALRSARRIGEGNRGIIETTLRSLKADAAPERIVCGEEHAFGRATRAMLLSPDSASCENRPDQLAFDANREIAVRERRHNGAAPPALLGRSPVPRAAAPQSVAQICNLCGPRS